MTKENNHGPYEFLGNMVVSLMNVDPSVSISFLETEIHVSRRDRKSTRLNSSHKHRSRMPSSA